MVLALHQGKTLRGSLFPLLPLRVKCQNHERVPISPISPILVVHVLSMYRSSGLRSTLNTNVITGLDMCKVCTEAVDCVAL